MFTAIKSWGTLNRGLSNGKLELVGNEGEFARTGKFRGSRLDVSIDDKICFRLAACCLGWSTLVDFFPI